MRLPINERWRARLRVVRQAQLADWSGWIPTVEKKFRTDVILLQYGLGTAAFLGLDGQVIGWNSAEGFPPRPIDNLRTIGSLINLAAHHLDLPDLVELLPPMPPRGQVCPGCGGKRWDGTPYPEVPQGMPCMYCRGLGWVPGRQP